MASFTKRGNRWRAEVCANGNRASKSFSTKKQAQLWANQTELEFESQGSVQRASSKTMKDAFERYASEVAIHKNGYRWEKLRLSKFENYDLAKVTFKQLCTSDLAAWRDQRLTEGVMTSTVRRELNLIRGVLSVARKEWKWLAHNPMADLQFPKSPPPRERRMREGEISKLLEVLKWHEGQPITLSKQLVGSFMLLALETGMRLGEICNLTEFDVNFEQRFLTLEKTKNGSKRHVPLSSKAETLLKAIIESGITVSSEVASTVFRKAVKKADIKNLSFHDTRHEAITRLARKLDVLDLAKMVGHRDPRSLMIYYDATPTEIAGRLG